MNKINAKQSLGEIVSIYPGVAEIFHQYKIDYCCGGQDTLENACKGKEISSKSLTDEINEAYVEFINSEFEYKDWRQENPSVLIEHILRAHHDYTKNALQQIDDLMFKILKVHFKKHSEELLVVHRLFGNLKTELEEHLIKEEENLFPLILAYEESRQDNLLKEIEGFIQETEDEHDAAGDILKELQEITNNYQAPSGACTTYRLTYTKLNELEKNLFRHIYLENSVLFPGLFE